MLRPVRLAISWMTVLPVGPSGVPDPALSGRAITALPVVGLICGTVALGVGFGLLALGASPLLAAVLAIAAIQILTRGMHVDALADTVDALGSYAPAPRALEIMRGGTSGPLAIAAVVLVLLTEVAAVSHLLQDRAWISLIAAMTLSRCLPPVLCRRGVPSASPTGFGASVAGSQGQVALAVVVTFALISGAALGLPGTASAPQWTSLLVGLCTAAALLTAVLAFGAHATRRFGGITGDVLGATIQIGSAAALVAAALLG